MKLPGRKLLYLAASAVALAGAIVIVAGGASSLATRTIKIVVPAPAGGGADLLSRLLAEQISRTQGPTIVIDNRPGAATVIGTEAAARAAPDGNTLLINAPAAFEVTPHLRKLA